MPEPFSLNAYVCRKCDGRIVTRNCHVGTTPFMLRCKFPKCDGVMESQFGSLKAVGGIEPTYEWYRREDVLDMTPDEFRHHVNGGVFLRPIVKERDYKPTKAQRDSTRIQRDLAKRARARAKREKPQ